ncbi:MAG TPA: hypothetical protein VKA51_13795 [Rubrobacteraceae bacterium]|nr:hypothetical protein [Rubrobacteraceae bacterium]
METYRDGRYDGRVREDYEELRGFLTKAESLLEARDPRGAGEALKRAGVKAATMWGGVGVPALPGPVRDLISAIGETQNLAASDGEFPERLDTLLGRLDGLRAAFQREAQREVGATGEPPRP